MMTNTKTFNQISQAESIYHLHLIIP